MDNETMILVASIITALAETTEAREGIMYAALCGTCSLAEFKTTLGMLASAGLIDRGPSFLVTITPSGRALATKIESALASKVKA